MRAGTRSRLGTGSAVRDVARHFPEPGLVDLAFATPAVHPLVENACAAMR
jgi:hypothetical protein